MRKISRLLQSCLRSWPTTAAIIVAIVAGLSQLPFSNASPVASVENYPVPVNGMFNLTGRGYGHAHGMSQYGAKGAALRGLNAAQILNFYYPGTTSMNFGNPLIRVRLSAVKTSALVVPAQSGLNVTDGKGKVLRLSDPATAWKAAWVASRAQYLLSKKVSGTWRSVGYLVGPVTFGGVATMKVLFDSKKTTCKRTTEVSFPGTAKIDVKSGIVYALAVLRLETYMRGVVSSEMPSFWPPAALQAQSVAARSYAASRLRPTRSYDAWDSTSDQCWDGIASYLPRTDQAIKATAGIVRSYQGKPIFAQFSSSNGGWMTNGSVPYLVKKVDLYEQYSGLTPWTKTVSATSFAALDGPGGITTVTAVRVLERDGYGIWGGRVTRLAIVGTTSQGVSKQVEFTGATVRLELGLRSTLFSFTNPTRQGFTSKTVPQPVKQVMVSANPSKVVVSWKHASPSTVSSYTVTSSGTGQVKTVPGSATSVTFAKQPLYDAQTYSVAAHSSGGHSSAVRSTPIKPVWRLHSVVTLGSATQVAKSVAAGKTYSYNVGASGGVPSTGKWVVAYVVIANPSRSGNVTFLPLGGSGPQVTVAVKAGKSASQTIALRLGSSGRITVKSNFARAEITIKRLGYSSFSSLYSG